MTKCRVNVIEGRFITDHEDYYTDSYRIENATNPEHSGELGLVIEEIIEALGRPPQKTKDGYYNDYGRVVITVDLLEDE
jgi:hypothetical protein